MPPPTFRAGIVSALGAAARSRTSSRHETAYADRARDRGIIFLLLFTTVNSGRQASLIFMALPFAMIGGILALLLSGQYLSVPAPVGFISLFGVVGLNGMVFISAINQMRQEGMDLDEAIVVGCERRLRPVLMTALVAILGLAPMLFATRPGSEVQKPLAAEMVWGLITSTLMTLLVLPVLYRRFERKPRAS